MEIMHNTLHRPTLPHATKAHPPSVLMGVTNIELSVLCVALYPTLVQHGMEKIHCEVHMVCEC